MARSRGQRRQRSKDPQQTRFSFDQASLLKLSEGPSWGFRELSLGAVPPGETVTCLNLGRYMCDGF